jgi:DNA-binding PadR family transcriptional regulator
MKEKGFNKIDLLRTLEKALEHGLVQIDLHEYNSDKNIVCLTSKGKRYVESMLKDNVV